MCIRDRNEKHRRDSMTLDMIILKTLDGSSTLEVSVYVTCRGLRRVSEVRYYLPQGWALMLSKIKAMLDQMKSYVFNPLGTVTLRARSFVCDTSPLGTGEYFRHADTLYCL